jgi:hypothetical protein
MDCNIVFVPGANLSSSVLQVFTLLYRVLDLEQATPIRLGAGCQQR